MANTKLGALAAALLTLSGTASFAQSAADPFATGRILDVSFGGAFVLNTLQDQLETTNNLGGTPPYAAGPTLQSTDVLSMGAGLSVDLSYSQDLANGRRGFALLSASSTTGTTAYTAVGGSFPGSYDDGQRTPAGALYNFEIRHHHLILSAGVDLSEVGGFTFGAGLQTGVLNQTSSIPAPAFDRTITIDGTNLMFGVMGRGTHYTALSDTTGLRVVGVAGLLANSYRYDYLNGNSVAVDDDIDATGTSGVLSFDLSVQVEHQMSDNMYLTATMGYEGFYGVMNGLDTFLDVGGTTSTASFDRDHIGSGYLQVGFIQRF